MLEKNVYQWTSQISFYARNGFITKALSTFLQMQRSGVDPNETTISTTLTACARSNYNPKFSQSLHCLALKKGYQSHLFVSSGLVSVYCKMGRIWCARKVFDEMPERDCVSWNLMVSGYAKMGLGVEACGLFCDLVKGFVNDFVVASVLKGCAEMGWFQFGESVHGFGVKMGFDLDVFVGSSLVGMYCQCGRLESARRVFDEISSRDTVVWNTMITGYVQNDCEKEGIKLFLEMEREGVSPSGTTFSSVINASTAMSDSRYCRRFHAKVIKFGFSSDVYVETSLVDMYSKFLVIGDAERAFSEIGKRNVVSYNALITGYGLTGQYENALRTYMMLKSNETTPDSCTFIGLLTSCAAACGFASGAQVHAHLIKLSFDSDVLVGNSLVTFYSRCGFIDGALQAFKSSKEVNVVLWSNIISGLVQNNQTDKALELFREMQRLGEQIDEFSSSSVIKSVASRAATEQGQHVHAYVKKTGLDNTIFVGSALIDMYSKCGMMEDAHKVFHTMPEKNFVAWNSMINGYAQNGFSVEALLLFQEMQNHGVLPSSITFVGILLACNHLGLVQLARYFYDIMVHEYEISPSIEHCTCMVNLLACAGYFDEAEAFLLGSPFCGEYAIWRSLLSSCEARQNFDVASRAAEHCLRLEPNNASIYTILSNIYAAKQLWSEVDKTRDLMNVTALEKEPGCSWVEARN